MKLTGEAYPNARYEKEMSSARIVLITVAHTIHVRSGLTELLFPIQPIFCQHSEVFKCIVSPVTRAPLAISFQQPAHYLAAAVFGSASAKRTSSGFAIAPMVPPTISRQFRLSVRSDSNARLLGVTKNATTPCPF